MPHLLPKLDRPRHSSRPRLLPSRTRPKLPSKAVQLSSPAAASPQAHPPPTKWPAHVLLNSFAVCATRCMFLHVTPILGGAFVSKIAQSVGRDRCLASTSLHLPIPFNIILLFWRMPRTHPAVVLEAVPLWLFGQKDRLQALA